MVIRREAPKGYSAVVDSQREDSQDDTWRTLMPAPKSGDHLSYERLLHDILPFVRNLARRHCRRRQDREEAVQEKFATRVGEFLRLARAYCCQKSADRSARSSLARDPQRCAASAF